MVLGVPKNSVIAVIMEEYCRPLKAVGARSAFHWRCYALLVQRTFMMIVAARFFVVDLATRDLLASCSSLFQ